MTVDAVTAVSLDELATLNADETFWKPASGRLCDCMNPENVCKHMKPRPPALRTRNLLMKPSINCKR